MAAIWGNLRPLGSNSKDRKVANRYQGIEPGTLGCHARTLTTALLPRLIHTYTHTHAIFFMCPLKYSLLIQY